ncbi:MAG: hypothetical protein L0Y77_05755 [Chlorobi bacterium]|nr:hypothetical protein [Chlorobiota bacterium]
MPNKKYKGIGEVQEEIQVFIRGSRTITELINKTNDYIKQFKETNYLTLDELKRWISHYMYINLTPEAFNNKTLRRRLPFVVGFYHIGNHRTDTEFNKLAYEQALFCVIRLNKVKTVWLPDWELTLEQLINRDEDLKAYSDFLKAHPLLTEMIFTSYSGYSKGHDFFNAAKGFLKLDALAKYIHPHYNPKENTEYFFRKLKDNGGKPNKLTIQKMVNKYFKTQIEKEKELKVSRIKLKNGDEQKKL